MKYYSVMRYTEDPVPSGEIHISDNGEITVEEDTKDVAFSGLRTKAVLTVRKNQTEKSALRFVVEEEEWDSENYVFAPAALYNGNRFRSLPKEYAPMLTEKEARQFAGETVITDVPRLKQSESGCVQLNVGDLSFPCIGFYSEKKKTGFLLFFEQKNELGNFGVTVEENLEKMTAKFILSSPCVRTPYKYGMCTTKQKSDDCPAKLKAGNTVTFSFTQYRFDCGSVTEFLGMFFKLRQVQGLPRSHPDKVPFSYAYSLIEDKYNRSNWMDEYGFYKSSEAEGGNYRHWQTGWVGGAMNTLPGLILGNSQTKERSRKTIDFMFDKIQHQSGFLYGVFCDGKAYGDDFLDAENPNIVMSRKNADALYYLVKHFFFLKNQNEEIPDKWQEGLQKIADAFVSFYENNGEISQLIDIERGKPYVYGSASAGLVCAGLVLCASYFGCDRYMQTAEKIGEEYYQKYISKGYSTGGPGEILACPDSESAFALLESFVTLSRFSDDEKWLRYAEDTAALCASWCVGYDYSYEKDTQFFERGTATTGAVWASVQNKHAAPGICTMSGQSLLHLYRATGNTAYLELLKDISHNITQYVSTPEDPIYASYVWHNKPAHFQKLANRNLAKTVRSLVRLTPRAKKFFASSKQKIFNPTGRINERVNLSDWEGKNNVGEVPLGSCWCEVSAMLTYLDIPAVYIQSDTAFIFTLDHIECTVREKTDSGFIAELHNPTRYDANYRIFIDTDRERKKALPENGTLPVKDVFLRAGERTQIRINRR
ncbi:MAG: glycoside hydrolase family 47 protein [Acutalibacteraceae bacterium]